MHRLIKKNIWTLFYALLLFGLALLVFINYSQHRNIVRKYETELRYLSESTRNTTFHFLMQQEMFLDLLGMEILQGDGKKSFEKLRDLFDHLMQINPTIIGFAVSDAEGRIYVASSNNDPTKLPNLKKQKESRETFLQALQSPHMILGRPYYLKPIGSWMLPLRKAVRDENQRVVAVISIGLRLDNTAVIWKNLIKPHTTLDIFIDRYWYRIFKSSHPPSKYPDLYASPLPKNFLKRVDRGLKEKAGVSFDTLRRSGRCAVLPFTSMEKEKLLVSWSYLPRYALWIHYHFPMSMIWSETLRVWSLNTAIFLLISIILYTLFRMIHRIETRRSKELIHQALHDHLTGLPNRNYLQKHIVEWIHPGAEPFAIIFVDLDNFKNINDSMGHHYGDMILIEIAERLTATIRENALVTRHGGDEFIILVRESDGRRLEKISHSIIEAISMPVQIGELEFNVGASIGIGLYPRDGKDLYELLSAADIAMYRAKKTKNSFAFFTAELKSERKRDSVIEQELRGALEKDELHLLYQPQIDAKGRLHGVEALLRWHNERLGNVPPDRFIHIAEEIGLMPRIGHYVMERALRDIGGLQNRLDQNFCLSLNVSIRQFNEKNFIDKVSKQIEKHDVDRSRIVLEITESLFIEELESIVRQLETLRDLGLRISLDDFGTGYSSLNLLRRLPVDELKIDKSFIDTLLTDKASEAMVKAIITLCKTLGLDIVAEGVEERKQHEWLKRQGCHIYQGYHFAKPLKLEELEGFILSLRQI